MEKLKIEIINEVNLDFNTKILDLIDEVFTPTALTKLEHKHLKIHIPYDQKEIIYNLASTEHKLHYDQNGVSDSRGHVALPKDKNASTFDIVFNKSIFNGLEYYGTVTHELNHIIEFAEYFDANGNVYILDRFDKSDNFYFEFYFWTEFNSKLRGERRVTPEYERAGYFANHHNRLSNFYDELDSETLSVPRYYILMHYFAHIANYKDENLRFNEEIFPLNFLRSEFCYRVDELYETMIHITDYCSFDSNKELIREIIGLK